MQKEYANPKDLLSSPDMEMSVVGSIFKNDQAAYFALNHLEKRDFYNEIYAEIFEVVYKKYEDTNDVDKNIIEAYFRTHKKDDYYKYITGINKSINFCDPEKIEDYCLELKKMTLRRDYVGFGEKLVMKASDLSIPDNEVRKLIDNANELEFRTNPDVAIKASEIDPNEDTEDQLITGVPEWDNSFYKEGGRGLGTTELIFGRSGHGKTYYLMRKECQLAMNGYKGLHFNLEDTLHQSAIRIRAVMDTGAKRKHMDNIMVIDQHRYLHEIIKDIRFYVHKYDIKWVGVDHLGRVKVSGYNAKEKNQAAIEVSNQLTDLCDDLDIFGMFPVQPNKSYKQRKGWDNLLREEDLKGASEIFEDAFVVTTLFRPNLYPELRGGVANQKYVKDYNGSEAHYDSLYLTQIKNRRQGVTGNWLHMIQNGSALYTKREFKELQEQGFERTKFENSNRNSNPPHPADIEDDIPF